MFRHQPPAAMYLPHNKLRAAFGRPDHDTAHFQQALEQYLGVQACFVAASGRTALYLLLNQLSRERPFRPFVLLPAYTCPALVRVILDLGLRPCPIDISPDTFTFDMEQLASHLDERVLAVIHVHPFGIPLPIAEVMALAHSVGAVVIEDAAQAMGGRLEGRPAGTIADFGLFSLGPGKPLSVAGGGILCTNDEKQAHLLRQTWHTLPASTGLSSAWAFTRLLLVRLATDPRGWWLAGHSGIQRWGESSGSWGYKLRQLSPVQARIGQALLPGLDDLNQLRRENGRQIAAHLQTLNIGQVPAVAVDAEPVFLRLPLVVDTAERREKLHERFRQANIGAGRLYRSALSEIFPGLEGPPHPGALEIARRLLTLPTHHYLSQEDIVRIKAVLSGE